MDLKPKPENVFHILQCVLNNVDGYLNMYSQDRDEETTEDLILYVQKRLRKVVSEMEEDIKSDALNDKYNIVQ